MNNEDLLHVQRDIDGLPGGWKYTVPETGITLTAPFSKLLMDRVVRHLKANGHEVDDTKLLLIEHGICEETKPPGSRCAKRPPKQIEGSLPNLTLGHLERFLKSIWHALIRRDFVSREEVERRVAICKSCPLLTGGIGGCSGCYSLLRKSKNLIQKNPVQMDEGADVCGACGCYVPILTLLSNATLDRAAGEKMPRYKEGHCWRLEK